MCSSGTPIRAARAGEVAGAVGVDRMGLLALALRAVHVGPGGAVDDRLRAPALLHGVEQPLHRDGVGDVELRQVHEHELVPGALAGAQRRRGRASRRRP